MYPIDLVFLALVVLLLLILVKGIGIAASGNKRFLFLGLVILWLTGLSIAAARGFFSDFSSTPPHIAFALAPMIIVLLVIAFHRGLREPIRKLPQTGLIGLQSFRILMEVILFFLVLGKRISPQMTVGGNNYDVLAGISAAILGSWLLRGKKLPNDFILWWNVMCMLILGVTVVTGILSAPTRFRVFVDDVDTSIIGTWPYILLPGFVVPMAFLLHILSIRKAKLDR